MSSKSIVVDDPGGKDPQEFERLKLAVDSVKHITTLATGTIVLIATFADKLPKPLSARRSLIAAIWLMVACLLASFIYLWATTLAGFPKMERHSKLGQWMAKYVPRSFKMRMLNNLSDLIYFSFCVGIILLATFAIDNISK